MAAFFSAVFGWIRQILVMFGFRFAAKKTLITTAIVVLLPVVLWNFLHKFFEWQLNYLNSTFSGTASTMIELAGLAGYLGDRLNLVQVISVLLSGLVSILTLRILRL